MESLEAKTELFIMISKELSRLDYIKMFLEKRATQKEISKNLGISVRQVQRLVKAYRNDNYKGIISKKRSKISNNKISIEYKREILELIIKDYSDFGPTLATEKLKERHGYGCFPTKGDKVARPSVFKVVSIWLVKVLTYPI